MNDANNRRVVSRGHTSIHIGGVYASRTPQVIRTVLGSCIAVCLRDPVTGIGGMNHFMLPTGSLEETASTRYGVHAMELLINDCMKMGADRRRFEAKVFGGGHVLKVRETDNNVPQSNIRFALEFLDTERIPIISRDLGGYVARELYFHTDTGRVLLRRLSRTDMTKAEVLTNLERAERAKLREQSQPEKADDSNVTLF